MSEKAASANETLLPLAVPAGICRDPEEVCAREWLETNGLGGYASSTIAGWNTRRYHGLLVTATRPPVGRALLLSKLEETLVLPGGTRVDLGTNQYPGTLHPKGYTLLAGFRLDPFPVFSFETEGFRLEKSLCMVHGEDTTAVTWRLLAGTGPVTLEVRPLVAFRDHHALTRENPVFDGRFRAEPGLVTLKPYEGLPALHLAHDAAEVRPAGFWYRSFEYEEERQRGFDFVEDLHNPLTLVFPLKPGGEAVCIASTRPRAAGDLHPLRERERTRRRTLARGAPSGDPFLQRLLLAADQFVVAREGLRTVIAGYPWFEDWGRDTMIALPGLLLSTGRTAEAREVLLAFARYVDRGMLPNRFPDSGEEPEYNAADASLWYFEAVRRLFVTPGNEGFVRDHLWNVLRDIASWHVRGTRYGIRVDEDGLLVLEGEALTWMDARVGERPVTPRRGKPVEIQALWHNALKVLEELGRRFGDAAAAEMYGSMASRAAASFFRLFWNEAAGCLYDVVDGETRDASIRPNQLFALSLPFPILPKGKARSILAVVARELRTPYGLRTLSPKHRDYRGRYEGDAQSRDAAYHQGTVWPWLLAPFVTAWLRTHGRSARALAEARAFLAPLRDFVLGPGLGQIPEIFDGDSPQRPRGCIAQAWSVGEALRVLAEGFGQSGRTGT